MPIRENWMRWTAVLGPAKHSVLPFAMAALTQRDDLRFQN
jgi:hypothetical protein